MKLHTLFKTIINLNEVLNTVIPPDKWEQRDEVLVGTLIIDSDSYEIYLEPITYTVDDKTFDVINVAFAKIVNGKASRKLTLNNKSSSKILGAIINALYDKIKQFKYDAIVFIARDNVEKRMTLYNRIARNKGGNFLISKENIPIINGGVATVLYDKDFPDKYMDRFEQQIKSK